MDKSSSVSSRHIQYTRTILDFMRQGQSWNPLLISHLEKKVVLAPRVWHLLPLPLTRNLGVPETGGGAMGGRPLPPRFWQISSPISTRGADNTPTLLFAPPPADFQTFRHPWLNSATATCPAFKLSHYYKMDNSCHKPCRQLITERAIHASQEELLHSR